jgi:hypothetical protein
MGLMLWLAVKVKMKILIHGDKKMGTWQKFLSQDGWTSLETLVALFIIVLAFSAIALSAQQAIIGAQRISDKIHETLQKRNEASKTVVELLNR